MKSDLDIIKEAAAKTNDDLNREGLYHEARAFALFTQWIEIIEIREVRADEKAQIIMFTFWTVTNENTTHTNERSSCFGTETGAITEATQRIESGRTDSVVILKAIKIVRRRPPTSY